MIRSSRTSLPRRVARKAAEIGNGSDSDLHDEFL
jgi:hypothetical protein